MSLTLEQEAELARMIEARANSVISKNISNTTPPKPNITEEEAIESVINQLQQSIDDRAKFTNYT